MTASVTALIIAASKQTMYLDVGSVAKRQPVGAAPSGQDSHAFRSVNSLPSKRFPHLRRCVGNDCPPAHWLSRAGTSGAIQCTKHEG